jgi:glyoxylase-like metal-dependent hydrolase (beta-lactamase superfamily II)
MTTLIAGSYTIQILETGRMAMDGGAVFGPIPKALWQKKVATDEFNRVAMVTRSILISSGGRRILVDTGLGNHLQEKLRKIYRIEAGSDNLATALNDAGCQPDEITDVILTHLHFDHTGGALNFARDEPLPAFPNAVYHVQRSNFDWANTPCEIDRASYIRRNFYPLFEMGKLHLLDGETEIFPGIELLTSDGHTPGQQHVLIHDDRTPVFFCGDLFPTVFHLPTAWISAYDLQPLKLIEEKKRIVQRVVDENWRIIFPHDPAIAAAFIEKENDTISILKIDDDD